MQGLAALPFAAGLARVEAAVSPLLIDSHVHVWKRDAVFPFAAGANVPDVDASAEALLGLMRRNGVARTVLIQVIHYKWDNRYLANVLRRYPGQFAGVCRVNPEDPAAPDTLSRLTEEDGFHGVRLSPAAGPAGDWIRSPLMAPLWRRCAQLRVPMTLLLPATRLPDVVPLLDQNPGLTVVIDHMADVATGQEDKLHLLLTMARYPHVFVKLSHAWSVSRLPYPYPDALEQIKRLVDVFGAHRLMWGTDWPVSRNSLSYAQAVALYRDHLGFLSRQERNDILHGTVQRVWPFGL
ncbi:MAG: amidohydrolase family protein [Acidobacteriota bacterium]|nr:amidohydrolase family protein [Acidobacteriota bacterium]